MSGKQAVVIDNPRARDHDYGWRKGFAAGLRRRGWTVTLAGESAVPACDLLVLWGVRRRDIIDRAKAGGAEVCVLERGYVKDRMTWTSVSFGGGLNGRAEFRGPFEDASRWDSLGIKLTPWCKRTPDQGYALIMGQVPGDQSIKHVNIHDWYRKTAEALRSEGYEVRFRQHPMAGGGQRGMTNFLGIAQIIGDLDATLRDASVVVTFNSNAGVDSVIAGRRTVAMDRGSMIWDLSCEMLMGEYPSRAEWCSKIAWCQYTLAEMESGFCQEAVGL